MDTDPVILIDDTCRICNSSVRFLKKNAGRNSFRFISIYSQEGKGYLRKFGFPDNYDESVIVIDNNEAFSHSDAVLRVIRYLKGFPSRLLWLRFIPKWMRDYAYKFIGRHRHIL